MVQESPQRADSLRGNSFIDSIRIMTHDNGWSHRVIHSVCYNLVPIYLHTFLERTNTNTAFAAAQRASSPHGCYLDVPRCQDKTRTCCISRSAFRRNDAPYVPLRHSMGFKGITSSNAASLSALTATTAFAAGSCTAHGRDAAASSEIARDFATFETRCSVLERKGEQAQANCLWCKNVAHIARTYHGGGNDWCTRRLWHDKRRRLLHDISLAALVDQSNHHFALLWLGRCCQKRCLCCSSLW